jgi:hypothetical protein
MTREEFAMVIELPEELEAALKAQARARGVSPVLYVREVLERDLGPNLDSESSKPPFKSGLGMWTKYGIAPISAEEIDENRAEMFRNFGEEF